MVRDIPGFYYGLSKSDEKQEWDLANPMLDAEKKKYFKIQPNHAGPGQQHSKQVIRQKEGSIKRRKITHDYLTRQERETISRSNFLNHPLLGRLTLKNQLGEATRPNLTFDPSEDRAAYYASSLAQKFLYHSRVEIPGFVVNETNGAIIFAHSYANYGNDTLHALPRDCPGEYGGMPHVFEAMPDSFIDMSISIQHQKLLCVSGGPRGARIAMLDVPGDTDDPHASVVNHVWNFSDETAWQMTVSSTTGESFAIASSRGLRLIRMLPDEISCTMWLNFKRPGGSEYTAVAFGRDDRTVMAGRRSGVVVFLDRRTEDGVKRLFHGDAISAMRTVDENRVVVRGLEKMSLYDLRYTNAPCNKEIKSKITTEPYRLFPWQTSRPDLRSGFNYDPELGIIATYSSGTTMSTTPCLHQGHPLVRAVNEIQLFSIRTGKKLHSIITSNTPHYIKPISCIQFSHSVRSELSPASELRMTDNDPVSLIASQEGQIMEFSCQAGSEDKESSEDEESDVE